MKKALLILLALLAAACLAAMPFLCTHSNILPEVSTAYYEQKAQKDALTATGPEAELMRMLLGLSADTEVTSVATKPAFNLFGLTLAVSALAAVLVVLLLSRKRQDLRPALLWTAVLAVPFGLIGARLVYCLVNLPFYVTDIAAPEAMLKVWEGGLSLAGALLFIGLAGVIGAKIGKAAVGEVLDALSVPMLALCFFSAIANTHISMGFGPEVGFTFGKLTVTIGETPRLSTADLVVVAMVILCLGWMWEAIQQIKAGVNNPDISFALTAFLYCSIMILLESLRRDGHMLWGFVHAEMVFDLIFALAALLCLARTKKRILLGLLATAVLAGAVVALEFALDRSAIGDGLLYAVYIVVLAAYVTLGCLFARKTK